MRILDLSRQLSPNNCLHAVPLSFSSHSTFVSHPTSPERRNAKRSHATVGFDADTGLKDPTNLGGSLLLFL